MKQPELEENADSNDDSIVGDTDEPDRTKNNKTSETDEVEMSYDVENNHNIENS